MRSTRVTEEQIIAILKQQEAGAKCSPKAAFICSSMNFGVWFQSGSADHAGHWRAKATSKAARSAQLIHRASQVGVRRRQPAASDPSAVEQSRQRPTQR
jgi:hypothetical protein